MIGRHRLRKLRYLTIELQTIGRDLPKLIACAGEPPAHRDLAGRAQQIDLHAAAIDI